MPPAQSKDTRPLPLTVCSDDSSENSPRPQAAASRKRLNGLETPAMPRTFNPRISTQARVRGAARRVIAIEPGAKAQRLEGVQGSRNDGCRRIEGDDAGNRTGGGRAAERAILEMRVRCRVVVPVMRKA